MTSHEADLSHIALGLRSLAVPVAQLALMVGNPRSHPAKNLAAIKAALAEYGQVETILVNRRTQPWEVIHGNGRLQAAMDLGWSHVAANIVDVDDATAKAMAIVLNRTGELAEWNKEELDKLLREVQTSEKLATMLAELAKDQGLSLGAEQPKDPGPQIDRAAELQEKWETELGQLWLIPSKTVPARKVVTCPHCNHEQEIA
jgi:ParB-like chromosome segregation protein Spo0J